MHKLRVLSRVAVMGLSFIAVSACARDAGSDAATADSASAVDHRDCSPLIEDGWLRLPPVSMPMLAGFGRIDNRCDAPVTIVGVASPAFAEVSLHETRIEDGISRMRALPELIIAGGASATLQPGGKHLMLMQPVRQLQPGETVEIEFRLADGGTLRGDFQVRATGAGEHADMGEKPLMSEKQQP